MPLIKNGVEVEETWEFVVGLEATAPILRRAQDEGEKKQTYAFAAFIANADARLASNTPVGVRLEPEDDPHALAPYLDQIGLIEVSFPKYTDGRGYSQAQLLRRRLGYQGELRAVGHVLRDQILYMNRSGFDAYSTRRAHLSEVLEALREYAAFYQPAADGEVSVFARRHRKA